LGTYYWRAWAINAQGENCSENTWKFTVLVLPRKPALISPENNTSTTDNTPTFVWTRGSNADNHRIEVDDNSNFSSPIDNVVVISPSDNTWTKPSPGYSDGTYYWRIWAINAQGENCTENTWNFSIVLSAPVYPTKPQLYVPADGTETTDNTPRFEWTKGGNATSHRLLVDNDPSFTSPNENRILTVENSYTIADENFLPRDNYSWKVIAVNENGENSSVVWTFSIVPPAPGYPNSPPSCAITSPSDGSEFTVGMEIQFVCSASDPDGDPLVYAWDFGDGGASPDLIPKHAYTAAGDYTVTLTVSDGYGGMASDQITVHIRPWTPPPSEDEPSEDEPPENGPPPPYTPQTPPSGLPELAFAASVALLVVASLLLIRRMR